MPNLNPRNAIITQARMDIEDGSPARRLAAADRWIGHLTAIREPLADKLEAIAEEFRGNREAWTGTPLPAGTTPHAEQDEVETARHFAVGGWTATAFELLLTTFVSITTLAFTWLLAGLLGMAIAVLQAILVRSFLSSIWNSGLPRASVRRLTVWVWRSFWVCLIGIGALLVARTIPFLGLVADVALAVLSLALPILAGSLFVLAGIYGRFSRLEQQYQQVRVQVAELDQLLQQLRHISRPPRRS